MSTSKYLWWPISIRWADELFQRTLREQISEALESWRWPTTVAHHYRCQEDLFIHMAAARRFWHGWEQCTVAGVRMFGWTIHLGRLKILFGKGRHA